MNCELIHFAAADRVTLPGLLYAPPRARDVVIWLHGNGDSSVFYSARTNEIAEVLADQKIAFFPFNNRGAHLVKSLSRMRGRKKEHIVGGVAHEKIRDAVLDIDGAVRMLRARGFKRVHLAGHSTGANKICVYSRFKPRNPVTSYLLVAGGDDSGIYRNQWGLRRWTSRLEKCRGMIAAGRGGEFVPDGWAPFVITYASLFDTINPEGDYNVFPFLEVLEGPRVSKKPLFRHYKTLKKPTLVLYGANDAFCFDRVEECVDLLAEHAPLRVPMRFEIMPGADHSFSGMSGELGAAMGRWVRGVEGK